MAALLYEKIFKELVKKEVRYLVIGGMAVNFHGYPRVTGDLDIFISLEGENVKKFIQIVKLLGLRPRLPVPIEAFADFSKRKQWIKTKGMKVFSIFNPKEPIEHIDVMVENYLDFEESYRKRKDIPYGRIKVSVISIPDLIRLKKITGRALDQTDILALKQIQRLMNEKGK